MTDNDLLETVRTEFAGVRLDLPVAAVMARGRLIRRNGRWLPALGVGAAGAVTALTFGLTAVGAGHGGEGTRVVLDAWSVVSKPGGTVRLTIRDQAESGPNRARLGQALRLAGVPAVVHTALPRGCQTVSVPGALHVSRHHGTVTITIELSKLPRRAQVTVVVPAVLAQESTSRSRTEVRIPGRTVVRMRQATAIARRRHSQVPLPQVVVLGSATVCAPTAKTSKGPWR